MKKLNDILYPGQIINIQNYTIFGTVNGKTTVRKIKFYSVPTTLLNNRIYTILHNLNF